LGNEEDIACITSARSRVTSEKLAKKVQNDAKPREDGGILFLKIPAFSRSHLSLHFLAGIGGQWALLLCQVMCQELNHLHRSRHIGKKKLFGYIVAVVEALKVCIGYFLKPTINNCALVASVFCTEQLD
jgi:hypothetical protein